METPRAKLISRLYHAALEHDPAERSAFLKGACEGDDDLQRELESLLKYATYPAPFLDTQAAQIVASAAPLPADMSGRRLGPYTVVARLGAGGMGEVYRARDATLARDVALKLLPAHFVADPERRARLLREARILATLNHPHVGAIYGVEETDGVTALVLELVEGPTLADRLASGALPVAEALTIGRQIAEALDAAHEKGIVHRDLKPANVVLQATTGAAVDAVRVRVLDFGLAKLTALPPASPGPDDRSGPLATADGRILGTPGYMSPEQARGQATDKRADIWAFGCVLFEMLAGRRPFEGDTVADTVARILEHEPDWTTLPPDTPAPIRRLLERCLKKDGRRRLRDIADAVLEIDESLERSGESSGLPTGPARVSRRQRLARILVGTSIIALAGAAAAFVWLNRDPRARVPATDTQPAIRKLTANPVDRSVTSAEISADGRHLAFADPTGVHVLVIDSGETHRLPDTKGMDVYGWTPDSAGVLVDRCDDRSCTGWVIPLIGRERRPTGAVWTTGEQVRPSPDGQRLLRFVFSAVERTVSVDPMNGAAVRQLTSGDCFQPRWSADGTRVLYLHFQHNAIESVPADGGTPLEVFRAPQEQRIVDLVELVDGTILFSMLPAGSLPGSDEFEMWKMRPDATGVVREPPRRLTWASANPQRLSASSTGRVAFLSVNFQHDVYVADGDLRNGSLQTPRRLTLNDNDDYAYTWTPDSRTVILSSQRNGTWDIFKQPLDSDIAEPFLGGPRQQTYPGVTSSGEWVLYTDGNGTIDNIMRAPLGGGAPAQIVALAGRGRLLCPLRGECVLLEMKERSFVISSLHPFDGKGRELARIPGTLTGFRLLPDGDAFAYVLPSSSGIRNRVRVVSFTGQPTRDIVVKDATTLIGLGWLSSNTGFVATDERRRLLLISLDGSSKVLTTLPLASINWAVPSPDDKHVAINAQTNHVNVWMMTGF